MQRYFLYLAYDGTNYHGWQIQPNGDSVQQQLMNALQTLLRREVVDVTGAGRTDTGVHAKLMVAHFDHDEVIDCTQLADKLNRLLPSDISVFKVVPVDAEMHARFSAKSRRYEYYVTTAKSPFMRQYRYRLHKAPDFDLMNQTATLLLQVDDFTSFSKLHTDVKTNICHVTRAEWSQVDEVTWVFTIQADRFLRNMVRAVVGTLLEVGYGKLSLAEFQQVIQQKDRCSAGMSVPAQGLFLTDIQY
ncbi:MAG: tRNA pseudouridine(38-40) synthase TruA [Bacteroidaceae bacterium]|nr:tRNA pseudouridine(38-40) synthase TruA [Bacteroidaceae bacterium]